MASPPIPLETLMFRVSLAVFNVFGVGLGGIHQIRGSVSKAILLIQSNFENDGF